MGYLSIGKRWKARILYSNLVAFGLRGEDGSARDRPTLVQALARERSEDNRIPKDQRRRPLEPRREELAQRGRDAVLWRRDDVSGRRRRRGTVRGRFAENRREQGGPRLDPYAELPAIRHRVLRHPPGGRHRRADESALHAAGTRGDVPRRGRGDRRVRGPVLQERREGSGNAPAQASRCDGHQGISPGTPRPSLPA